MSEELVLSLDFESVEGDPPRFPDGSGRQNHAVGTVYSTAEPIGITRDRGGRVGEGLNVHMSNWATVPSDDLNLTGSVNVECWFRPAFDIGAQVHTLAGGFGAFSRERRVSWQCIPDSHVDPGVTVRGRHSRHRTHAGTRTVSVIEF